MVKFVNASDVLFVRNIVLRDGKLTTSECVFENDEAPGSFHLGYEIEGELVSVASFHKVSHPDFPGIGYQLRGMATLYEFRGKGYGNMLLNFAIVYLRGQKANYIWCNARQVAYKFYLSLGFEFISDEFEVPEVGPHRQMYLKIV
ncbi:GCN5-related N-acetyltransferase [Pseudopedobacter saltans DSM 12145]|uniref:GCN5-related N-acetyltransferase n=1 Tax=Pseudopedobacter saltans (strain ATCC 51119 / DSM 12145 / JCM 21818 / CCUG 39354 / LMG 10337 / NBRC 100064 / NCIMB 13643) TaxID=762903 RepID=F0SCV8_PSESL|nr:GNAT family N-acetyltransferase [Pseudopedobacter saltans]ADY50697.1 GCN5-related N-acetyltransferase [Pseudopedobacter saltans DSM 12145]